MTMEVMEYWLKSGRSALINQKRLRPLEHKLMRGKPLSSQKGQATAFFLSDEKGNWWILKKFHNNCHLGSDYLDQIASLLPKVPGCLCGTERQILSHGKLTRSQVCYYSQRLDSWLEDTILMPRVNGYDWATLADEIRDGTITLDESQRLTLCKNLAALIEVLENHQCCHRDLSCGNVFVDTDTWQVSLIDFDSLYHPSLRLPPATTCGTSGYTAHHAWNGTDLDANLTWCPHADRYALALLNVEFILASPQIKATGEGGIFEQDELHRQTGSGIDGITMQLRQRYPRAASLLTSAITSKDFSDCPSPQDWLEFCGSNGGIITSPPRLAELQNIPLNQFADRLDKCRSAAPLWPVPSLPDLPVLELEAPRIKTPQVNLPVDPWLNRN